MHFFLQNRQARNTDKSYIAAYCTTSHLIYELISILLFIMVIILACAYFIIYLENIITFIGNLTKIYPQLHPSQRIYVVYFNAPPL